MKKYYKRSYGDRGWVIVKREDITKTMSSSECEIIFLSDMSDLVKTHYVGATIWPNIEALIPITYEEAMLEIL